MDFTPTTDQDLLQQTVRQMLTGTCSTAQLREMIDKPELRRRLWNQLADTGVFSLRLDEADDGIGFGCAEAAMVFEELGSALVPGPLVWSHLAAGPVRGAADGTRIVGGIDRRDRVLLIEHADLIDDLVVIDSDGIWSVDLGEVVLTMATQPIDPLTTIGVVSHLPQGTQIGDHQQAVEWQQIGAVLTAAQLVGVASAATALAVEYAKQRQQFGRAVGSFQAIKHILADMLARGEVARAASRSAGVHLDDPELAPLAARAAAVAKIVATEAGVHNTKDCIQVHGGIGFTWEAHPQLLAKRAQVLAASFGTVDLLADSLFG